MAEIHHEEFPPIALRRSLLSRAGSYMAIHSKENVKRICNVNFPFYKETSRKFLKTRTNAPIFNIKFKIMLFFADNKKKPPGGSSIAFSRRLRLTTRNRFLFIFIVSFHLIFIVLAQKQYFFKQKKLHFVVDQIN